MTTSDLERQIRIWYADEIGETEAAPHSVHEFLRTIPQSVPREESSFGRRTLVLLAAAALLIGLLGSIAVGSGLLKLPSILPLPAPSHLVDESPAPSPQQGRQVVAYVLGGSIWRVNTDGTGTRELVPGVPSTNTVVLGWLPDGSRLIYGTADGDHETIELTDQLGSERVTYESLCPVAVNADAVLDACHADLEGAGISPDGTRVAYAVVGPARDPSQSPPDLEFSAIAILDLATGHVTQLDATETSYPLRVCDTAANQGANHTPTWSPDGTGLMFTRDDIGPSVDGRCQSGLFTVNADGSDLRQLEVPAAMQGQVPVRSPDGSTYFINAGGDVYTARAGLADISAATNDGLSAAAGWTRDGRIILIRWSEPGEHARGDVWVMDADGANPTLLEATVPALTAAGCVVCPYPVYAVDGEAAVDPVAVQTTPPFEYFWITQAYWQPIPDGQGGPQ